METELTQRQRDVARWLQRVGKCSLRLARKHQISQATLDAIVDAGLAERYTVGPRADLIYTTVGHGATPRSAR
jgi:hypothetical protein